MAQDSSTAASDHPEEEMISPKLRRRLQECYDQGTKLMTQDKYDFDYVHTFLVQCVLRDPANTVYLDAFLENLHRKYNNNKRGAMLNFGGKGPIKKAVAKEDWEQVLTLAANALKSNPWDVLVLRAAAEACGVWLSPVGTPLFEERTRPEPARRRRQQALCVVACSHRSIRSSDHLLDAR